MTNLKNDHRLEEIWQPKINCKCPRCYYYWHGFEKGRRMKSIAYQGFLISYHFYPVQNRYSAEALIDNGSIQKWIYLEKDSLQKEFSQNDIIQMAKDWIEGYLNEQ